MRSIRQETVGML